MCLSTKLGYRLRFHISLVIYMSQSQSWSIIFRCGISSSYSCSISVFSLLSFYSYQLLSAIVLAGESVVIILL